MTRSSSVQRRHCGGPSRMKGALVALCIAAASVQAKDECAPWTWTSGDHSKRHSSTATSSSSLETTSSAFASISSPGLPVTISPLLGNENTQEGEINCRYTANTGDMPLNTYTCAALALKYRIPVDKFFILNPRVHRNCDNLEADTDYCVKGCTCTTSLLAPSFDVCR